MKTSVVVCTFNGQRFLDEQLQSIAKQTRLPDEVVICDDCSTDDTWSIIERFAASSPMPVQLMHNRRRVGVTHNFEGALRHAKGDVIFLSDQDDVWLKDKLEYVASLFEADPGLGMVVTDIEIVGEDLTPTGMSMWQASHADTKTLRSFEKNPLLYLLSRRNIVSGAGAAFSKAVVRASLPFPRPMAVIHDAWLAQVASCVSHVKADPQTTVKYRQHPDQLFGTRKIGSPMEIGRSHYQAQYQQLICLRDRLDYCYDSRMIEALDNNIHHIRARLDLPKALPERLTAIAQEAVTGRYGLYSNGIRSIVKDLMLPGTETDYLSEERTPLRVAKRISSETLRSPSLRMRRLR